MEAARLFSRRQYAEAFDVLSNHMDGMTRPAVDADVEAWIEWHRECLPSVALIIQLYYELKRPGEAVPFVLKWYEGIADVPSYVITMCILMLSKVGQASEAKALAEKLLEKRDLIEDIEKLIK